MAGRKLRYRDGLLQIDDGNGSVRPITADDRDVLESMELNFPASIDASVRRQLREVLGDDLGDKTTGKMVDSSPIWERQEMSKKDMPLVRGVMTTTVPSEMGIQSSPPGDIKMILARLVLKNLASATGGVEAFVKGLKNPDGTNWQTRRFGPGQGDFGYSSDGKNFHLFDPTPFEAASEPSFGLPMSRVGQKVTRFTGEALMDLLDMSSEAIIGTATTMGFTLGSAGGAAVGHPIIGGAFGAVAAQTLTEAERDFVGSLIGIPNNVDPKGIATTAAFTALLNLFIPGSAALLKKSGRAVKRMGTKIGLNRISGKELGLETLSALSNVRGAPELGLPAERVLELRALDKAGTFERIPGISETAEGLRKAIMTAADDLIPENAIAREMEAEAAKRGAFVDIQNIIDKTMGDLVRVPVETTKTTTRKVITSTEGGRIAERDVVRSTLNRLTGKERDVSKLVSENLSSSVQADKTITREVQEQALKFRTGRAARMQLETKQNISQEALEVIDLIDQIAEAEGLDMSRVPPDAARVLLRSIQKRAADVERAFTDAPGVVHKNAPKQVSAFGKVLKELQTALNNELAQAIDIAGVQSADGRSYQKVMGAFHKRVKANQFWRYHMGANLDDPEGIKDAAEFISRLHGPTMSGFRKAAEDYRAQTGIDLNGATLRALLSELYGEAGASQMRPQFGSTGAVKGTQIGQQSANILASPLHAIGIGGLLGFGQGGLAGGLAGVGLGAAISSQATALQLTRFGMKSGPMLRRLAGDVSSGVQGGIRMMERPGALANVSVQRTARRVRELNVDEEENRRRLNRRRK